LTYPRQPGFKRSSTGGSAGERNSGQNIFADPAKTVKIKIETVKGRYRMSSKRHEGSLHGGKKTKRVRGTVDRIVNGLVVVLTQHPDNPDVYQEIYVPLTNFKKRTPEPGDRVTVLVPEN
jgi:hypothetical protein